MRTAIILLALLVFLPAVAMAWPQPGDAAPTFTLPDTANVMHTIPSGYAGHVIHLVFWQST